MTTTISQRPSSDTGGRQDESKPISDSQIKSAPVHDDVELDVKAGDVKDLDQAEVFLHEHGFSHTYLQSLLQDEQAQKKICRRVDWILMPLLCGTYMLQYIDKQTLSYSAVFDLFESTGTTSNQYSWLASIFYFGYLFFEWPASYLAQHFPTGRVVSIFVITWGCLLMITAACQNFAGLAPARAGAFYCFNGVGSSVGGILFYAVGQGDGFTVWRSIFILCGGVTVLWGVVLLWFLPNNIMTAKRFTSEEKALLIARTQQNQTGVYNQTIKTSQIKEALLDPQCWILFFFTLLNETVNGGVANFGKLIVKGLSGGDALLTTAYGIPQGAWQVFFVFTGPYIASRFKNIRTIIMIIYIFPTIIGFSLFWNLDHDKHPKGLLVCYYIVGSYVASLVLALQLPATNVGGYTKRVTATAFVFLGYCAGNIIGPHAWLASEAPVYQTGCKVCLACACGQIGLCVALRAMLIRRNKKRDQQMHEVPLDGVDEAIEDRTDFENPAFRYSY
ncbi:MFS general substrate transporter [Hortaea werneckii]|nr:MFS general substrate transporter [Hortaea werneckii]KAI6880360.1 MFS general substrate transporter [Hortaea werneckii]KAI6988671.1 MFS general substrate transporter [Hortaea werneckii]KAI7142346.1 MFS general substrate transporter [Hortaea werneckii]KAI7169825.1 MFS general substrate transporter [Hortaea werneckii]